MLDMMSIPGQLHQAYMGVYLPMAFCVMILYVREFGCVAEGWYVPIEMSEPVVDGRISTSNVSEIGLEMLNIDNLHDENKELVTPFTQQLAFSRQLTYIEARNGCIQSHICLC